NGLTTGSLSTSSAITVNGALVFNRSNAVTQGTDFASGISGNGSVTQAGGGTLTLSGTNTYAGGTNFNNGTVNVSADSNLGTAPGSAANNLFFNGGILALTSGFAISGNRSVVVGAAGGTISYTNNNVSFTSAMSGSGG